jgi:tetratricopeptide (TPR) repeat protein
MKFCVSLVCIVFVMNSNAQTSKDKANAFYTTGNYTKAIETYKSLKNLDDVYGYIAKAYMAIGNYGEAVSSYQKAVKANPENALLKYEYAKLLSKTKQYKEANTLFKNLIATDGLNPNYHYELGLF